MMKKFINVVDRRAASTCNLDGVCAVINNACAALETEMCPALKQQLKLGYPSGYLDLTQAYNVVLQGRLQASDSEQARNTFLVTHWLMIPILADSILLLQKQQFCGKLLMV